MSYPATWMNLKHILLNKRGLTEKTKYFFIAVYDTLENGKCITMVQRSVVVLGFRQVGES